MSPQLRLTIQPDILAVCRLEANQAVPEWAFAGSFHSVTRTTEELSIVCPAACVPQHVKSARNWRMLKVEGPLDFSLTGILAGLAQELAQASISIFAISTFDTDYILVREDSLEAAAETLRRAGYQV